MEFLGWLSFLVGMIFLAWGVWIQRQYILEKLTTSKAVRIKQRRPLSTVEVTIYWRMRSALPEHMVLHDVVLERLVCALDTLTPNDQYSEIRLPFVICSRSGQPIAAFYFSHPRNRPQRILQESALKAAGITLIEIKAEHLSESQLRWAIQSSENKTLVELAA